MKANSVCTSCGCSIPEELGELGEICNECFPMGRTFLMNSAVMPSGNYGRYQYEPATIEDLKEVVRSEYISCLGYPQTAELVEKWTGVNPSVNRGKTFFRPGDRALVMRLKTRVNNPATKGAPVSEDPDDWELAWVFFGD